MGWSLVPPTQLSVTRLRCMNSTCFLSLIDITSMRLNVERKRQRSHAADSEVERREYMLEACNKKDYTVQEQKVIEHVQIQVHALKPARITSPYEEMMNK